MSDYIRYLFLGKVTDSLSPAEQRQLDELFATDPDAVKAYQDFVAMLPQKDTNESFSYLNEPGFWKDLPVTIKQEESRQQTRRLVRAGAIAATLVLLMFGGWMVWNNRQPQTNFTTTLSAAKPPAVELRLANGKTINLTVQKGDIKAGTISLQNTGNALSYAAGDNEPVGINSITVSTGLDYRINLGDGSAIWLNSTTTLEFPSRFAKDQRRIKISGEAYLQIAKDASRPFLVDIGAGQVQVTGTEFNVNSYDQSSVKIALISGGINVSADQFTLHIKPGNQAVLAPGSLIQENFDAKKTLSWQKGLFYFEKADLDELSQVLSRWYGIKTTLDDPALSHKKFAGILDKNKPVSDFLDNLKVISRIDSRFDKDGVLHFK